MLSWTLFLLASIECRHGYHGRPGHYGHGNHGHGHGHGYGHVKNGRLTVFEKTLGMKDHISDYFDDFSDYSSSSSDSSFFGFSLSDILRETF